MSENNEPAIFIGLENRESYGITRKFVTFEDQEEPFAELPYPAFESFHADITRLVRSTVQATKAFYKIPDSLEKSGEGK